MKSFVGLIMIFMMMISYSYSKGINSNHSFNLNNRFKDYCHESKIFRDKYLKSVEYIQEYIKGTKSDRDTFLKCLKGVVRQSRIKSSIALGYRYRYKTKSDFYSDKKKWLFWYELNKCDNLKWK